MRLQDGILAVAIVLVLSAGPSTAGGETYFDPPDTDLDTSATLPDTIKAGFIFISFPDQPDTVADVFAETIPQEMEDFYNNEARGSRQFEISTIIDPRPGMAPDENSPNLPYKQWIANYNWTAYDSLVVDDYENYRDEVWGEVSAETVFRIAETYGNQDLDNPLLDFDYLFFVHQKEVWNRLSGLDGVRGIANEFLVNIPDTVSTAATGFNTYLVAADTTAITTLLSTFRTLFEHEFGHKFAYHMTNDGSMSYGIYAPMRPTLAHNMGFIPFHHRNSAHAGWIDQPAQVTGQLSTYSLRDLQATPQEDEVQVIEIPLDYYGGLYDDESFFLSLHSGLDYASNYPGDGVAIWHATDSYWDLEQAAGRWDDPDHQIGADPVSGLDLMDDRWVEHNGGFTFWNRGYDSDFFEVGSDTTEFSYRTNPSTLGGRTRDRMADQDVPVSLIVLITGDTDTTIAHVEVLASPREAIVSPSSNISLAEGDTLTVTWADYFEEEPESEFDILDEVVLWFSPNGGVAYERVGTADYYDFSILWVPTTQYATTDGRVKLVFTNTLNEFTGVTESQHTVTIAGTPIPWEIVMSPNGGEEVLAGEPVDIKWTSMNDSTAFTSIDLEVSTDSGQNYSTWAEDISYDYGDTNSYTWLPDASLVSGQVRVKLVFNSSSGTADDSSDDDFLIYSVNAKFLDVTSTGLPTNPYDGIPGSVVPIAADNDTSAIDLVVSIESGSGAARGKLFTNDSSEGGELDFSDDTIIYLPNGLLEVGFSSLSVADFDNDGDEDIFACRPDGQTSQLFRRTGNSFASCNSTVFAPSDTTKLQFVQCAAWIDYDHDGDLDIYLGRTHVATGIYSSYPDALFEYDSVSDSFEEVAFEVGLDSPEYRVATTSVAWGDMDNDGLWEVAVGGGYDQTPSVLLEENTKGRFTDVLSELPLGFPKDRVSAFHWVDYDRDNDLDLIVVCNYGDVTGSAYICQNSNGAFTSLEALPTGEASFSSACPLDYDLDGWVDLLLPNSDAAESPVLLANLQEISGSHANFTDIASPVGLTTGGAVGGILATDLNRDGDPDLYLGREDGGAGTLYARTRLDSTDIPEENWIGIRLESVTGSPPVGAVVSVSAGTPLGCQVVDGGSGNGYQQSRDLIFGLGDEDGSLDVTVVWPSRREDEFSVEDIGEFVTIAERDTFTLDTSTVDYDLVYDPYTDTFDWVFTWETNYWTEPAKDEVEVSYDSGSGCESMPVTLKDTGTGEVVTTITYQKNPSTGEVTYLHEVRWVARDCYDACTYTYEVQSGLGTTTESYAPSGRNTEIVFDDCPQSL